ncbi:MAG: NAD-dependent epimerase/dehydratase family protein [Mycobacteriales bacterium]
MKLLMIGGTKFVGRAYVDEALKRGHDVTLFTRGKTNPDVFPEAEHLVGDRESDLSALEGRMWDAVIDTCGYEPDVVRRSASLLNTAVGHYTFVSSISVYADRLTAAVDESSRIKAPGEAADDDGGYGWRKAECERVVREAFDDRALILRPGLIVGPHEDVGRLPFWLHCAASWARVIAPAPADRTIQLIDARDIAAGGLGLIETHVGGVLNVTAPEGEQTFRDLVADCLDVTGSDADVAWVDDATLERAGIEMWTELPLWAPMSMPGTWAADVTRAQEAGFVSRQLRDTVDDTWRWFRDENDYRPRFPWLTQARAASLS